MFDIWQNIAEKGAVAVPLKAAALTPLGWAEIGEVYPDLLPDECRNCDVYSDPQLIRESPFVNDMGTGYLFTATDPIGGRSLKCALCCDELTNRAGANDYHYSDEDCNPLCGILTCSCGYPGCDGFWSQSFHVSSKMVHWSILRYREKYELFFEREAYEFGLIRMLKDMCEHPGMYDTTYGSSYQENHASFVERVHDMLQRRPYFQDMWNELVVPT